MSRARAGQVRRKVGRPRELDSDALEGELRRLTTLCKMRGSPEERQQLVSLLAGFEGAASLDDLERLVVAMRKLAAKLTSPEV